MATVSYLDVELRARADQYQRELQKASNSSKRYAQAAKRAEVSSKSMGDSISRAAGSVAVIDGPLGSVAGRLSSVAAGFRTVGVAATGLGVAVAAGTFGITKSLQAYADLERRQAKTAALIKATGQAAGFTAKELDGFAREMALGTLASTNDMREAIDVLLTFKSVQGQQFKDTIGLAQDIASILGTSAKSAALQLGKALEDPLTGLTALNRAGISFNDNEKELIKSLVEANKQFEAQAVILQKVAGQLGGTAAAEAEGLAGAWDTLAHRWGDLIESIGKGTADFTRASEVTLHLAQAIRNVNEAIDPSIMSAWEQYGEVTETIARAQARIREAGNFNDLPSLPIPGVYDKNDWYNDQRTLGSARERLKVIQERIDAEKEASDKAKESAEASRKVAEAEREAAKATEMRAKAAERAAAIMEKQGGLWQQIFGGGAPQRKTDGPVEKNVNFNLTAQRARGSIESGNAGNVQAYIKQMEQILAFASRDLKHNFDVDGMRDVIDALKAFSEQRFGATLADAVKQQRDGQTSSYDVRAGDRRWRNTDGPLPDDTRKFGLDQRAAKGSVLELRSEQVNLNMTADSAQQMAKQISEGLKAQQEHMQKQDGEAKTTLRLELVGDGKTIVGTVLADQRFIREVEQISTKTVERTSRRVAQ